MKIWVLFNDAGEAVTPGAQLTTFRGEDVVLEGGTPPKHPGSTGRIYVKQDGVDFSQEFFPSVCGLTWQQV